MTSLVKKIDQRLDTAADKVAHPLGAYVIFDSKADGLDKQLQEIAEKQGIKRVNLCIGAPPNNYEVANEADVTVVIYNIGQRRTEKVVANFALRKGDLTEAKADAIVKALAEVLPK